MTFWWVRVCKSPQKTFPTLQKKEAFLNVGLLKKTLKCTDADKGTDGETADDDSARAELKT